MKQLDGRLIRVKHRRNEFLKEHASDSGRQPKIVTKVAEASVTVILHCD